MSSTLQPSQEALDLLEANLTTNSLLSQLLTAPHSPPSPWCHNFCPEPYAKLEGGQYLCALTHFT